ncbi:FHA domain-containing protein [Streptomyces sp. AM 2-1-1]|uniref:FHA domain-containing protein n=1 Tax=Streptomyces sp. AM 2-1-1 TaxID=3028709 RepID=UPI0023B8BDEF|nr:FHA domain-containing protein [Streptomyces sp. AM 2-1-1]WEH41782.1 FHA domain-containing protein [Streptomyces sp. AM 2-1-1]
MSTCPNGHQSGSEDWCEVCGHRMTGAGAPGAVPPPPAPPAPGYGYPQGPGPGGQPTAAVELCPQCRTPREPGGPFCEECRWNFLTNTATSYTPLAPQPGAGGAPVPGLHLPPGFQAQPGPHRPPAAQQPPQSQQPQQGQQGQPPQQRDPFEYQSSRPSQLNRPAEPLVPDREGRQAPPSAFQQGPPPGPQGQQGQQGPQQGQQGGQQPPQFTQGGRPQFPGHPGEPSFPQGGQGGPGQPGPPQGGRQAAPPAYPQGPPPAFQQSAPPVPGPGPSSPPDADDWMLPPPSQAQGRPQAPQAPVQSQPHAFQQQSPPNQQHSAVPQNFQNPQEGFPPPFPGQGGFPGPQHAGPGAQGGPGGGQEPPRPATWTAVIAPDRDYFLAMMQRSGPEAGGLNLPAYSPEQHLQLTGGQVTIGRRRHSTGESPDIDLAVPPEDPGVSHQHAVLVQQPDGGWAVVDQNSTNGTTLNGAEEPIQPYVPVPLQDGDQVHVGAWTTITVRRG